jgi:hypothetical protein
VAQVCVHHLCAPRALKRACAGAPADSVRRTACRCVHTGGECASFGCRNGTWTGYACEAGAVCSYQSEFYWQVSAGVRVGTQTEAGGVHPDATRGAGSRPTPLLACALCRVFLLRPLLCPRRVQCRPGPSGGPVAPPAPPVHTTLAVWAQCGGAGGPCANFGGAAACADRPFPGYTCGGGARCVRQDEW